MQNVSFFNINSYGQLGNQFFNILSAIGTARSLNLKLYVTGLEYFEEFFNINYEFADSVNIKNPVCKAEYSSIDELKANDCYSLILYGYLINPWYFRNLNIKDVVKPKFPIIESSIHEVVFHVRLGDYVSNYSNEYTILAFTDYYQQAKKLFTNHRIIIVTDSPDMAKTIFKDDVLNLPVKESLAYIIGAQNLVCANSTFSWMGASLSNAKRIVVPDVYTKEKNSIEKTERYWPFHTDVINVTLKETNQSGSPKSEASL